MTKEIQSSTVHDILKSRDRNDIVWFSARCALRGLSVFSRYEERSPSKTDQALLISMRCILHSAVVWRLGWHSSHLSEETTRSLYSHAAYLVEEFPPPVGEALDSASLALHALFHTYPYDSGVSAFLHARNAAAISTRGIICDLDFGSFSEPIYNTSEKVEHLNSLFDVRTDTLYQQNKWSFWRDWYQGFLEGKPLDWELQRRVALIPDEDWEQGPEHIAEKIEKIRAEFEREINERKSVEAKPISDKEKQAVKDRVSSNREALTLSIASLLEQLAEFRERVRALNSLEPDFKQELLDFIDTLFGKLDALLHDLPEAEEELSDEKAGRLVLWLSEFRPLVHKEAAKYVAPQNVAEACVPTGIILGLTGVGSLLGGPAGGGVGALVGSLITGQIKPAKAAEELTKPEAEGAPPT